MKELDEYCIKILTVLLLAEKSHFNELFRLVNKKGRKFSRPTFNTHLKHLMEAGYVKRTPDKGQLVNYSLNHEKIGKMNETVERIKRITKSEYEDKKEFFSLPEEEQVNIVLGFFTRKKLYQLKAGIEY
ncbi:MAG: transcriptional regulator, partial [Dehalococcoidia bacterium]